MRVNVGLVEASTVGIHSGRTVLSTPSIRSGAFIQLVVVRFPISNAGHAVCGTLSESALADSRGAGGLSCAIHSARFILIWQFQIVVSVFLNQFGYKIVNCASGPICVRGAELVVPDVDWI